MSLPVVTKTWTITACNRIPFVSLNDTMSKYLYGVKNFLVANGYTLKGSSNGTTGGMDAVDRWATAADAATRASSASASQSWVVLTDGSGVDILITYLGSSDDCASIYFSPTGTAAAAGDPTYTPSLPDAVPALISGSLIGAAGSTDRIWSGWVDSESKLCRFAVVSNGYFVCLWGVELCNSAVVAPAVFSPPVWGFGFAGIANVVNNAVFAGKAKTTISSVDHYPGAAVGSESWSATSYFFGNLKAPLQGGAGYPMLPLSIASNTAGTEGKLGNLYDVWTGYYSATPGDTYGALEYIAVGGYGGAGGGVWPWDGVTTPVML